MLLLEIFVFWKNSTLCKSQKSKKPLKITR